MFSRVQASLFSMGDTRTGVKRAEGDKALTHDPRKLRRKRYEAGLSVTELAALAECSKAHVSMLEKGGLHSASPVMLRRFAQVLDCEIADLMPDENGGAAA
jgi:predicted transcriptional regulator